MMHYKNFQFSWPITLIFAVITVFMILSYIYQWGTNPIPTIGFVLMMLFFLFMYINFYGMTVLVDNRMIMIRFGAGIFKKRIPLSDIESAAFSTYPPWYGYGIRYTPKGWLFNVSGREAVELRIRGKKMPILIGTRERNKLLESIKVIPLQVFKT